jgi:hypothetical protein
MARPNLHIITRSTVWALGNELDNEVCHIFGLHCSGRQRPIAKDTQEHWRDSRAHTK